MEIETKLTTMTTIVLNLTDIFFLLFVSTVHFCCHAISCLLLNVCHLFSNISLMKKTLLNFLELVFGCLQSIPPGDCILPPPHQRKSVFKPLLLILCNTKTAILPHKKNTIFCIASIHNRTAGNINKVS